MTPTSVTTIKPLINHLKKHTKLALTKDQIHCIILIAQAYGLYTDLKDWTIIDDHPYSGNLNEILNLLDIQIMPPAKTQIPQEFTEYIKNQTPEELCKKALIIYHSFYNPELKPLTETGEITKILEKLLNLPSEEIEHLINTYLKHNTQY